MIGRIPIVKFYYYTIIADERLYITLIESVIRHWGLIEPILYAEKDTDIFSQRLPDGMGGLFYCILRFWNQ